MKPSPPRPKQNRRRKEVKRKPSRRSKPQRTQSKLAMLIDSLRLERNPDRRKDGVLRTAAATRLKGFGALLTLGFFIVLVKAGSIMLLPDAKLETKAQIQFERQETITGRRGDILDRNHEKMATSVTLWNLALDPNQIREQDISTMVQLMGRRYAVDTERLSRRLLLGKQRKSRWLVVKEAGMNSDLRLDPADIAHLKSDLRTLLREHNAIEDYGFRQTSNAVHHPEREYRFYPNRDEAAPLLGPVNHDGVGAGGLEQTYNDQLRGEVVHTVSIRDRKNNRLSGNPLEQNLPYARDGQNLVLTIDRNIQHITDRILQKTLTNTGAAGVWGVVMDVRTGELLAISSQPTMNLNNRSSMSMELLKNQALTSVYEPGSLMKPLVGALSLNEGLTKPNTIIDCENGSWRAGGMRVKDDHPHKEITVTEIIQYSSNEGIAKIVLELGASKTLQKLRAMGFGRASGVLFPGTPKGILRRPSSIKPMELITTAYGYGMNATMLQLTSAFATLGNKGMMMQPLLLKERLTPDMELIQYNRPEAVEQIISEKSAKEMIQIMEKVVQSGTAKRAKVPGYRVAGKTGTSMKSIPGGYSPTERIGSFIGLIPADDPVVAIGITVDNPTGPHKFGGFVAAPAFSEIAASIMRYQGIPPDPDLLPPKKPAPPMVDATHLGAPELQWRGENQFATPNLVGLSLRDTLHVLSTANLQIQFTGSGLVHTQHPAPGTIIAPGETVEVSLQ